MLVQIINTDFKFHIISGNNQILFQQFMITTINVLCLR